jgi:hypothetical protein
MVRTRSSGASNSPVIGSSRDKATEAGGVVDHSST